METDAKHLDECSKTRVLRSVSQSSFVLPEQSGANHRSNLDCP